LKTKWKLFKSRFFLGIAAVVFLAFGWLFYIKMEGEKPGIKIEGMDKAIQASQDLSLILSDDKSGLRNMRILLKQNDKEVVILEEEFPAINAVMGGEIFDKTLDVHIEPKKAGFSEGEAVLQLEAADYSWRNWWKGNLTRIEKPVRIDTRPPVIEVLTKQHNINQGGAGLVIYRVSESCPKNGVQVGDNFFPGYSARSVLNTGEENIYMSLMALDYSQGKGTQIYVEATDLAGNTAKSGFYHYIKPRRFNQDTIRVSDGFLNQIMPEFEDELQEYDAATPLEKFLVINQKLRVLNTGLLKDLGARSENTLYWEGAFLRLPNAARRASFADHREYLYNDQVVDHQVHMGIDLASTSRAPVPAANNGRVAFTGQVGIYGGTIVLDHGFGLFSSYSHLSSINVTDGQIVARGDIIAQTGSSGLAGGDHLHYGMIVHNIFVNPVEWWDPAWIENNITAKIEAVKSENLSVTQR